MSDPCDPMDCSLPGSSVLGIVQARILEWVAISFSRGPSLGFPGDSAGKESTFSVGDLGSIPGLGRSPGKGKGYPLQYSGLENFMDCIVHRVAKKKSSNTGLMKEWDIYYTAIIFMIFTNGWSKFKWEVGKNTKCHDFWRCFLCK